MSQAVLRFYRVLADHRGQHQLRQAAQSTPRLDVYFEFTLGDRDADDVVKGIRQVAWGDPA